MKYTIKTDIAPAQIAHTVVETGRVLSMHLGELAGCEWCDAAPSLAEDLAAAGMSATAEHVAGLPRFGSNSRAAGKEIVTQTTDADYEAPAGAVRGQRELSHAMEIDKLRAALNGAEERMKLLFDAKNHWMEKAALAEARASDANARAERCALSENKERKELLAEISNVRNDLKQVVFERDSLRTRLAKLDLAIREALDHA